MVDLNGYYIAGSSNKKLSYNSVKMTPKSCFLKVAMGLSTVLVPAQLVARAPNRDLVPAQLVAMAPNRDHLRATETAPY